jgi:branched-chain amino acid transport system ATP-binding protein
MLAVDHLQSAYGPAQVLFDIGLRVGAGEVVTLLGRNGMGKTTTIHTIMGLLPATGGSAVFDNLSLVGLPPHRIAQAGLGLVPEGRQIFPTLTVEENLIATAASRFAAPRWSLDRVYSFFPQLSERRRHMGNELSGGEQQMLAIGRAIMTNPKVLLLDEPSLGLSPILIQQIFAIIREINAAGMTILLVEQNALQALGVANRGYVLQTGRVILADTAANLAANADVRRAYLGEI